jgi:uncharacterized protein (DUF1697 family)
MRLVALFRGVNVGGVRVPMAELRELLAEQGLREVRTLLASGNAVFDADLPPDGLARRLETVVGERFGYPARILVVTIDEVAAAVRSYPFEGSDDTHAYVVFTEQEAVASDLGAAAAELPEGDQVQASGRLIYWRVAVGSTLGSPFGKLLARRKAVFTTTRNLRTLEKILAAA